LLFETFLTFTPWKYGIIINRKARLTFNFNCLIDTEGFLKVTGSHVRCKRDNMLETVQDRDIVTAGQ